MDKQATDSPCELWQKELGSWWLFSVDQDMVSVNLGEKPISWEVLEKSQTQKSESSNTLKYYMQPR